MGNFWQQQNVRKWEMSLFNINSDHMTNSSASFCLDNMVHLWTTVKLS